MKMIKESCKFSLEIHDGTYEDWPSKTKLFSFGEYTGTEISGYVIEAQFSVNEHYLIITSQDCPFEESNDFILLNDKYEVVEKKSLGRAYDSFLLEEYKIISNTELKVKYHGERFISIRVNPSFKGLFKSKISYKICQSF